MITVVMQFLSIKFNCHSALRYVIYGTISNNYYTKGGSNANNDLVISI